MKTQKIVSHKEVEYELDQYISENCVICKEELIRIEDIFVGKDDDLIYCKDCKDYHRIDTVECRDIIIEEDWLIMMFRSRNYGSMKE